jgi:hypothetical protein
MSAGIKAYNACMVQYTLRKVPRAVDSRLRKRARVERRSLNSVALEALARGAGLDPEAGPRRDLRDVAGTWVEDPEFEKALALQHRIDGRLWR